MKKIITSALVLTLTSIASVSVGSAWAQTELKGNPEELRQFLHPRGNTFTIQGSAEKTAYTDKAIIDLVFTTEEKQMSDALAKNSQLRADVSEQLMSDGLKSDDIKSAKFSSSPEYGFFGKKPKSYTVTNRMSVTITTEKQLQSIAIIADKYDEVELAGSRFEHSLKEQFEQEMKTQALAKVMAEKATYEKALGIKLTPVGIRNIYVSQNATAGAALFQTQEMARITQMDSAEMMVTSTAAVKTAAPKPASFDEVQYVGNIVVEFKVETDAQ